MHRDIYTMAQVLGVSLEALKNYEIAEGVRLFPVDSNSEDYPGDTDTLGMISYFRHYKLLVRAELACLFLFLKDSLLKDSKSRDRSMPTRSMIGSAMLL